MSVSSARVNLQNVLHRTIYRMAQSKRAFSPEARKALWRTFDATARKWERRYAIGAADAFEHDRREILAIINEGKRKSLERKASIDWATILQDILYYLSGASQDNWRSVFSPLIAGTVIDQGEQWAARLGVTFDVQNLGAREWLRDYTLVFAQPINQTTSENISQILARAQADGSSIPKIQKQLDALFERYTSGMLPDDPEWEWFTDRTPAYRKELIAKTECIRASNAGTDGLFADWNIEQREWLSTQDDRTRSRSRGDHYEHLAHWPDGPDGEVKPMGQPFMGTGQPMQYPGDPNGSPANFISCRCTIIPYLPEDVI
jgi:hypothetical protein